MARSGIRQTTGRIAVALALATAMSAGCGSRSGGGGATGGRGVVGGVSGTGGASSGGGGGGGTGGVGGGTSGGGGTSSGGVSAVDGGAADTIATDAGGGPPLGMNDVTILAPLPTTAEPTVLLRAGDAAADGTALVPRALYDRLVLDPDSGRPLPTLDTAYERLHLIAVRFDLCDRNVPGPCASSDEGRLRLVFQPLRSVGVAEDMGFHAFYSIRNDELPAAVAALRELARGATTTGGFLRVSPALSAAQREPYAAGVRAFVRQYAGEGRVVRLTMNAQNLNAAAFVWMFRGLEKKGDAFVDIPVAGSSELRQSVTLTGTTGFSITPMTDTPSGLLVALTPTRFDAADVTTQRASLAALAAADNPLSHTAETVACAACHVSTVVMRARTAARAIDPQTLPGRYTSSHDLSTEGGRSAETPTTLRALGYLGAMPMISQRVVNETAQTLTELAARFPAP